MPARRLGGGGFSRDRRDARAGPFLAGSACAAPSKEVTPRRVRLDKTSGRSIVRTGMDSVDVELGLDAGEMLLDRPKPDQDGVFRSSPWSRAPHRLEALDEVIEPAPQPRLRVDGRPRRLEEEDLALGLDRVRSRRALTWQQGRTVRSCASARTSLGLLRARSEGSGECLDGECLDDEGAHLAADARTGDPRAYRRSVPARSAGQPGSGRRRSVGPAPRHHRRC
jgi:hypothetical protein